MNVCRASLAVLLLGACSITAKLAVDTTITEKTKGIDVVEAVIKKLSRALVFPPDRGSFTRRIACAESQYGNNATTYADRDGKPYYGGVWQLNEADFLATQRFEDNRELLAFIRRINGSGLHVDWTKIKWSDLYKPVYSGLSVRLFLWLKQNNGQLALPDALPAQAEFWKRHFHPNQAEVTAATFVERVNQCEGKAKCRGRMDMTIVLDGSGSIGQSHFEDSLKFVNDMIDSFSVGTAPEAEKSVRFGFLQYSNDVTTVFALDNTLTATEMRQAVSNTVYKDGGTATGLGMAAAIQMYATSGPARPGVPKVMTVFTDGMSSGSTPDVETAAREAKIANITTFGVGIGDGAYRDELEVIAQGDVDRVYEVSNFDALKEFFRTMNEDTCKIPQTPATNSSTPDKLVQDEKRYYLFTLPLEGLAITLNTTEGVTAGYYSYTEETPSSALHDGVIQGRTHIPYREPVNVTNEVGRVARNGLVSQVYISVAGLGEKNTYAIGVTPFFELPTTEPPATTIALTSNSTVTPDNGALRVGLSAVFGNLVMMSVSGMLWLSR